MAHRYSALGLFASTLAVLCIPAEVRSQTRDGAVLGGVAGAVIGGIVGHQNNETPEGALIGGAVGAIAGGVLGKQQQQQQQLRYYEQQQAYRAGLQTTYVQAAPAYTNTVRTTAVRRPVSVTDVITLTRSGLSETVIINHINASGVAYQPNTDDVLTMHDAGVTDVVINAMQHAPTGETIIVSQPPVQPRQVIIREEYRPAPIYITRPIHYDWPGYHHHYHPSHGYHH